jgi:3-deoxy-D-manno-octulosonate 8-phosphate phosphatase KdsC-like HAD superfamily phosphatase
MNLKTIYYRGHIRSCNYHCHYCPFRKTHSNLAEDEAALKHFCEKVPSLGNNLTIMFVPHGEAMIHDYYHRAIADLCKQENVSIVGCQTNLSFDIEKFAENIGSNISKISLWCTFHPSQVSIEDFLKQCEKLIEYRISFCVGSVGHPSDIPVLQRLKDNLPHDIYMWINAEDGLRREYTDEEIAAFSSIDPLFNLELKNTAADSALCIAGRENIFVRGNGDYFSCNISKVKLGNIYSDEKNKTEKICRAKNCDCYLAYSNRLEMKNIFLSSDIIPTRNPSLKKAIFFDVDGTLTDASGIIPDENIKAVQNLSQHHLIFLATSLPFEYVKSTCKEIWNYLSGGVFAEGSDIRIFDCGFKKIIPLDESVIDQLPSNCKHVCYREDEILHKVTVVSGHVPKLAHVNIVRDDVTGIVSKDADKLSGVLCICEKLRLLYDNVSVVGNSTNDVPMLTFFQNSIAVPEADESAKAAAKIICGISKYNS